MSGATKNVRCSACEKVMAVAFPDGVDRIATRCPHCGKSGRFRRRHAEPAGGAVPNARPPGEAEKAVRRDWAATLDGVKDAGVSLRPPTGARKAPAGAESRNVHPRLRTTSPVSDAPSASSAPPADYLLGDPLGRGGMGVVLWARQTSLGRRVAIKTIRPDKAGKAEARAKFLDEAHLHGLLDHPNIAPLYDLGVSADGELFCVMKEVDGEPWSGSMALLPPADNLDILLNVCDAVAFAHSRRVAHLDLKPANVMLGRFGEVYLMDWGLAARFVGTAGNGRLPGEFALGGTPAYMAPEMARCDAAAIGPRTDVYLLGALLYEILTGRPPHRGETIYQCMYAAYANVIDPVERDDELAEVARKALAADPKDRYGDVKEFQQALRHCRDHEASRSLAGEAAGSLATAEATGDYMTYARAVFGFQEALRLWPGNNEARRGGLRARRAYARKAIYRGEFELAQSLVFEHEPDWPAFREELAHARLEYVKREKAAKKADPRRWRVPFAIHISSRWNILLAFVIAGLCLLISQIQRSYQAKNHALAISHEKEIKEINRQKAALSSRLSETRASAAKLQAERDSLKIEVNRLESLVKKDTPRAR